MFEYALAAGLTASGADAYLLHVTTTPSVSFVARTEDFDCGIMISASPVSYTHLVKISLMAELCNRKYTEWGETV